MKKPDLSNGPNRRRHLESISESYIKNSANFRSHVTAISYSLIESLTFSRESARAGLNSVRLNANSHVLSSILAIRCVLKEYDLSKYHCESMLQTRSRLSANGTLMRSRWISWILIQLKSAKIFITIVNNWNSHSHLTCLVVSIYSIYSTLS